MPTPFPQFSKVGGQRVKKHTQEVGGEHPGGQRVPTAAADPLQRPAVDRPPDLPKVGHPPAAELVQAARRRGVALPPAVLSGQRRQRREGNMKEERDGSHVCMGWAWEWGVYGNGLGIVTDWAREQTGIGNGVGFAMGWAWEWGEHWSELGMG
eukprot:gene2094-biopygen5680